MPDGEPTLFTDAGEMILRPGMVAGVTAGGSAHHLEKRTDRDCAILEIGDRTAGDAVDYPDDDIQAMRGGDGQWRYTARDGTPY